MKKDIHNAIIPIDFSDPISVHRATETVQDFVKRKIPIRFGLVPVMTTEGAAKQAQVVYHILDTYGLGALMQYLEAVCVLSLCISASLICLVPHRKEDFGTPRSHLQDHHRKA